MPALSTKPAVAANKWIFPVALIAMLLGMVLAWSQLALQWGSDFPEQVAAKVGEQWIPRAELQRAINGANTTRREALNAAQEQEVLQRLINELLLLQYGQDLGLVVNNPSVRKPLVQAVLGIVRANAKAQEISDEEARDWFGQNAALFQHDGQYQLRYFRVLDKQQAPEVLARNAQQLRQQLIDSGSVNAAQLQHWQADRVSYLPSGLLPPNKLRDYLGQTLADAVMDLKAVGVTQPIKINSGFALLQVTAYQPAGVPPFSAIKAQVIEEMRQQAGENALAELLQDLQSDYDVQIAPDLSPRRSPERLQD